MPTRYFTLDEAQGMVPWLEETFLGLASLQERLTQLHAVVEDLRMRMRLNGGSAVGEKLAGSQRELKQQAGQIEERLREIRDRGVIVKSVERGLVDFPCVREGREVYLCWRKGEKAIEYWHEVEVGFAGRRPL